MVRCLLLVAVWMNADQALASQPPTKATPSALRVQKKPKKTRFTHQLSADTHYYRTSPAQATPPDGVMPAGTKVQVNAKAGSYVLVQAEDGTRGYVATDSLEKLGSASSKPAKPRGDFVRVTMKGTVRTGVVAIGGETTGTTITAENITWELDLGEQKNLQEMAQQQNGKTVIVNGTLTMKQGVEIPQRWIVAVTDMKPVTAKAKKIK